ncbi:MULTISPECIES: CRISPR-associated protein Cas4 [Desulfofundulus]|uniref:CRISPR-associated exonuclease Cas4 n=2 Tax=Desulfofundulus TaxID=2282741 RepID=A0A494X1I7_9FIRM|nr:MULTISPECIES: CRISPR-associated protein Cas4 [Desulfofundulus]RKO66714.1 CRISPR-associated protein Cas4 [Desulfofundulus salinum]SHJ82048.1 CRISPR-associated exonuclease, Cas4 family [Desulfofundulus thermosubterraneus DSM 16057]
MSTKPGLSERSGEIGVSGTLVWYYYICPRQVWLIAHQLTPDAEDDNLAIGRFIGEMSYAREKKELAVGSSKMDVYHIANGELVVGEVKKSSKYRHSARMQLAFYLKELHSRGIPARGELRFPKEKKREDVVLDEETLEELERVEREILRIVYLPQPPPPSKNRYCKKCAYAEFCWS